MELAAVKVVSQLLGKASSGFVYVLVLSCALVISLSAHAASDVNTKAREIAHLFAFVKATQCRYERNGSMHSGPEAAEHMQKKYDYYFDDIHTTEDFIRLAASKSALSGKQYKVHCPDKPARPSQRWLLNELSRYRSGM